MSADTPNSVAVVIAAGASLSQAIDLGMARAHRLEFPDDAWTDASVTFQASYDGVDFDDLFLDTAEYVVSTAAVGRAIILNQEAFYGVRRLKVRSGTAAAPVNQAAERILRLVKAPE